MNNHKKINQIKKLLDEIVMSPIMNNHKITKQVKILLDELDIEEHNGNIMDRIKTYSDACEELGTKNIDYELREPARGRMDVYKGKFEVWEEFLDDSTRAYIKLKTIVKALNEGWEPNWDDSNEFKWYPYFKLGLEFSHSYCVKCLTSLGIGSRFCFKSKELSEYAGKQFKDLYKDFLT